jgi:sec-independent protein translocase protein TatA
MLQNIGTPELMVLALILLLMFGGKKIPEMARGVSGAIKEYKDASKSE